LHNQTSQESPPSKRSVRWRSSRYQKYNDYSTVKYDQIANSEVVFPYDYEHVSLVGDFIFDSNGNVVFINRNEQLTAWINKP